MNAASVWSVRDSNMAMRGAAKASETAGTQLATRADALRRCADVCNETMTYGLEQGGEHAEAAFIRCLVDTAELCTVAANAIARESDHAAELLEVCADVCGCTAEACAEFDDDAQMTACKEACEAAFAFATRR